MRIVSFNVENLFERARALNRDEWVDDPSEDASRWSAGRDALEAFSALNRLLQKDPYSADDKAEIVRLMTALGLERSDESALVILRRNRGRLVKRPRDGGLEVVAGGRSEWIGWLELKREPVSEIATQNTARILRDVRADVAVVVEAEHRISLQRFSDQVLPLVGGTPYDEVMLIDGNDDRGIDLGLLVRRPVALDVVRSHISDREPGATEFTFSRDCPEYHLQLPSGERLVLLANHLKSKGYGGSAASNARRKRQAARVRAIYEELRQGGIDHVIVAGDLNDTPDSDPLSPLLQAGSDLQDVSVHPAFVSDGRPGTYGNGTKRDKIDYLLLSPSLFARVTGGGIDRRGVWGGRNGTLWPRLPEMEKPWHAASDHAAIWADLDL